MERRDLDADASFRGGRGQASNPPRARRPAYPRPFVFRVLRVPDRWIPRSPRPAARADRSVRRTRPIAAAVLLGALTTGWLVVGHRSRAAEIGRAPAPPASAPAADRAPSTVLVRGSCPRRIGEGEAVHCTLDGVRLEVREYPPGTAAA